MSPFTVNHRFVTGRRAQRGQTLIVALAILFLLLFIGGLFVTRIGRNLVSAGRSRDQSDATQLAQAGLDYCNKQLNETPEGADWRPTPTAPLNNGDPDYFYLEKGFTRLPLSGGRALVRVAYDPHPTNPLGNALRIESVGIPGELPPGGSDPTIFVTNSNASRLRKELIAYKQFGLIDYGHFYTNKDHRTNTNYIGTPNIGSAVATVLGNPMIGFSQYANGIGKDGEVLYGFPIRSNSDVTFGDDTYLYESPRGQDPSIQQESVLVAGALNVLSQHPTQVYTNVNDTLYPVYLNQEIDQAPTAATAIRSTTDAAGFTTFKGIVRDNSLTPDVNGYIRAVPYITPPSIDTLADNSSLTRYRVLTQNSGYFYTGTNSQAFNTGQFGYGTGIYINNTTDLQPETKTAGLNGAYSQRADWLNPNAGFGQGYWNGPFYRPPGVLVELLGDTVRITRSDGQSFLNADGTVNPNGNNTTLTIPLADAARTATTLFTRSDGTVVTLPVLSKDGDTANANSPFGDKNSYGVNLVLFAEGNIRVRGVYGAITNAGNTATPQLGRVHITLVTNGTAYIEGSLVRGDGYIPQGATQPIMERGSTCAVLAKDYVCLNTTMFMQPMSQTSVWNRPNSDLNAFTNELGQSEQRYDTGFIWGVNPSTYTTGGNPATVYLMLRHGVLSPGPAAINLLVNPGLSDANAPAGQPGSYRNSFYLFNEYGFSSNGTGYLGTPETYLLGEKFLPGNPVPLTDAAAITPNFEMKGFPLNNSLHGMPVDYNVSTVATGSLPFILQPGYINTLRFQVDQTAGALLAGVNGSSLDSAGLQSYLLGSLMVAPLDVRIEAALYAQERSFFVIPGYALNPDPTDTRQSYIARNNVRVSYSGSPTSPGVDTPQDQQLKDVFPFYNEPMDVRITVFGAIAENYAASQSDQQAWMSHWGFIPQYYGSTQYQNNGTPFTSQIPVPDDHLMVHDPYNPANEYSNLVPGLDTTLDYRTPIESLPTTMPQGVNQVPADMNPYRITRGLRTMYDPAFAMPYFHPTDNTLSPDSDAAYMARKQRALRSITTAIQVPNGGAAYNVVQVLPPIPRLPMCPNYVYAGESDRLIGSNRYDTDSIPIQ